MIGKGIERDIDASMDGQEILVRHPRQELEALKPIPFCAKRSRMRRSAAFPFTVSSISRDAGVAVRMRDHSAMRVVVTLKQELNEPNVIYPDFKAGSGPDAGTSFGGRQVM